MKAGPIDPAALLRVLNSHAVTYIVIGGYAATAQDVVWPTRDVDVLVEPSDANLVRLLAVLDELGAEFDTPHQPPIRPTFERLRTLTGPLLFRTKHGRLDVLREAAGESCASLMADHHLATVAGLTIPIASLPALLRMKRAANREKDLKVLPLIEAAIDKMKSKS